MTPVRDWAERVAEKRRRAGASFMGIGFMILRWAFHYDGGQEGEFHDMALRSVRVVRGDARLGLLLHRKLAVGQTEITVSMAGEFPGRRTRRHSESRLESDNK